MCRERWTVRPKALDPSVRIHSDRTFLTHLSAVLHAHTKGIEDQRRDRHDALLELADLDTQLVQTQLYNYHMARELVSLRAQVH